MPRLFPFDVEHFPAGEDHRLSFHVACFRLHPDRGLVIDADPLHCDPLADRDAPIPGALGQRHRGVDRACLAVTGYVDRAHQVVDAEQRPHLARPLGVYHLHLHAGGPGHGHAAQDLLPALLVRGHRDRSRGAVAGGLAGLVLQFFEEAGGIRRQSGQTVAGLELAHQPGRVPGGPPRQGVLLQEEHVGDAPPGQVVGDRAPDDPAADHHDLGPVR